MPWGQLPHHTDAMTFPALTIHPHTRNQKKASLQLSLSASLSKQRKVRNIAMLLVYVFTMLYFLACECSSLKQFITKCRAQSHLLGGRGRKTFSYGQPETHSEILSQNIKPEVKRLLRSSRGPGFHFLAADRGNPTWALMHMAYRHIGKQNIHM